MKYVTHDRVAEIEISSFVLTFNGTKKIVLISIKYRIMKSVFRFDILVLRDEEYDEVEYDDEIEGLLIAYFK